MDRRGPPSYGRGVVGSGGEAERRFRALLHAHQSIMGDLDLDTVLTRVVETACDLVDAPYGALGVLTSDGRALERFVHLGMAQSEVEAIGRPPEGKGLLGALVDDPRPIRLTDLTLDPRSVGFPEGHPRMSAFLGVPIRIGADVYGNLYVAKIGDEEFSAEDEELLVSLAATSGTAIANARLFAVSEQRGEWLAATADITRRLLSIDDEAAVQLVAEYVHRLADADAVAVVLPDENETLRLAAATGDVAASVEGTRYPMRGTVSARVLATNEPVLTDDVKELGQRGVHLSAFVPLGPVMVLPLAGSERVHGTLVVGRHPDRPRFSESDLAMAVAFASQAALAVELADARQGQQRVLLWEDRARIARDLHDHVVQQLFAAGMLLQGVAARTTDEESHALTERVIDGVDEAVKQIRTSIFQLRPPNYAKGGVRRAVLDVVEELAPSLGFRPHATFAGPVDVVGDADVVEDVRAVVREALSNVAKHAGASRADLSVHATANSLEVVVTDDGCGLGGAERRSGLENLRQRAALRDGAFVLAGDGPRGTSVRWTVRLG
jgi:signal transduction histidine kinase